MVSIFFPVHFHEANLTGPSRLSINDDRARPAMTRAASILGPHQVQRIPQEIEKSRFPVRIGGHLLSVNKKPHRSPHISLLAQGGGIDNFSCNGRLFLNTVGWPLST